MSWAPRPQICPSAMSPLQGSWRPLVGIGGDRVDVAEQAEGRPVGPRRAGGRSGSAAPARPRAARTRIRPPERAASISWPALVPGGLVVSKRISRCQQLGRLPHATCASHAAELSMSQVTQPAAPPTGRRGGTCLRRAPGLRITTPRAIATNRTRLPRTPNRRLSPGWARTNDRVSESDFGNRSCSRRIGAPAPTRRARCPLAVVAIRPTRAAFPGRP